MKSIITVALTTVLFSAASYASVCPLKYGKSMNRYAASTQKTNYYVKATRQAAPKATVTNSKKVNLRK